jgi:hypothetical protein
MSGKFTINETLNTLKAIFEKHKSERICVIGTTCIGKSTLVNHLADYNCEDLDDVLWSNIPKREAIRLNKLNDSPWTNENGNEIYRIIYTYGKVKPGYPLFGSTILKNCEVVVYLDISDNLLEEHCKKRGDCFLFSKKYKEAIENDWNNHKMKNDKAFYYLTITE